MLHFILKFFRHHPSPMERLMANLADTLLAVSAKLDIVVEKLNNLSLPKPDPVDFTPVTAALGDVKAAVDAIKAELTPTAPPSA